MITTARRRPPARHYPYRDRAPTRITSWDRGDGWVTVRIERTRVRTFNVSTDEIPALLAELGKYVRPVTVARLDDRPASSADS